MELRLSNLPRTGKDIVRSRQKPQVCFHEPQTRLLECLARGTQLERLAELEVAAGEGVGSCFGLATGIDTNLRKAAISGVFGLEVGEVVRKCENGGAYQHHGCPFACQG